MRPELIALDALLRERLSGTLPGLEAQLRFMPTPPPRSGWTPGEFPSDARLAAGLLLLYPGDRGPSGSTSVLASQLADQLRDAEDSMFVERFIDRQIVVLDMESATIQVLCDAQTLTAAVRFSELLNDPDRPPARCTHGTLGPSRLSCMQRADGEYLRLDFVRVDDAWRLLGGILPRGPVPFTGDGGALVREYRSKLNVSACPP